MGIIPAFPTNDSQADPLPLAVGAGAGVAVAGFVNRPPLSGNGPSGAIVVEGKPFLAAGPFTGYAIYRVVGGEYFQAMEMPLQSRNQKSVSRQ